LDLRVGAALFGGFRLAVVAALLLLGAPAPALAQADEPPVSEERAVKIAERDPNAVEAKREHPDLFPSANQSDSDRDWEVGFFADDKQLVLVVVDDQSGEVEESWTGHQVAWRMARGYDGAFGRKLNAPYVWLPLCAIFLIGLFDWRRPLRPAHLDLLVLVAGFGVSHFFFNRGDIGLSVPLAYPALLYLLARTLWLAFRGGASGLRPSLPITWLAIAAVALIGFRVGLNVSDSNVIDVGYSGVIGADLITDGEPLYDNFPDDNRHGDTYGPAAYYVYTPFEQVFPWGGDWDDLPAAHAGAIFFDLATIAALFLLGRRLRPNDGRRLATLLVFAWAAFPYTAFALESNTNDSLVALLLVCALYFLASPAARGGLLALATLTKFAPVALVPLFATYRGRGSGEGAPGGEAPDSEQGEAVPWPPGRALRVIAPFAAAFAAVTLVVMAETLIDPGLSTFWDRTVGNQAGRDSPFSVWGQEASLDWLHTALKLLVAGLAVAVAFVPRRRGPVTVAALGAAVLIALQLTVEHWFYLYIPWFAGFLFVALLARPSEATPEPSPAR
jgi:Glycosyltransferase family 87